MRAILLQPSVSKLKRFVRAHEHVLKALDARRRMHVQRLLCVGDEALERQPFASIQANATCGIEFARNASYSVPNGTTKRCWAVRIVERSFSFDEFAKSTPIASQPEIGGLEPRAF